MGLEEHVDDVWTLFAAVATHKYVISFCMGVELVSVSAYTMSMICHYSHSHKHALFERRPTATDGNTS